MGSRVAQAGAAGRPSGGPAPSNARGPRSDLEAALLVADALHVFGQLVQRVDFDCGVGLLRHAAGEVHHAPVADIERVVRERHEPRHTVDPEMVAWLQ